MIVDAEYIRGRVFHYFDVGKREIEAIGPETNADTSDFCPVGTVISPAGQEASVPLGHNSAADKRKKMWAVSQACKIMSASALLVRFAGTSVKVEKIAKEIHLHPPHPMDRVKYQYFEDKLFEWVEKKTGQRRLGGLPREYTQDALIVSAIGPGLTDIGLFGKYEWRDGKLIMGEPDGTGQGWQAEFSMVPKWWD